jgi:signal transduction histidine kinase
MTLRRALPWAFAVAAATLGCYAFVVAATVPDALTLPAPVHVAIGWSFVGAGTVALVRRPDNRVGQLMGMAGLVWFGRDFDWTGTAATDHLDAVTGNLFVALVAHLLVVFPDGVARPARRRMLVAAAYLLATVGYLLSLSGDTANTVVDVAALAVAVGVLFDVALRWRSASPPARKVLLPVAVAVPLVLAVITVMLVADTGNQTRSMREGLHWAALVFIALPAAFLIGLLRARLHRGVLTQLVLDLAERPSPDAVQAALAKALGDPGLQVAYWLPDEEGYVGADGREVRTAPGPGRTVTVLEDGGHPVAALVHDRSLLDEPDLVRAAGAAARLALENARLQAELRARLEQVRASRARIVLAGDAERRRLERNLHDGVQQRLLAIKLSLRAARSRVTPDAVANRAAVELLVEAEEELSGTLEDLRALARGIHPAVLTEEGLAPAVETLTRRSTIPVLVDALPDGRLPAAAEAAAYYVVAEALANVAKHAGAALATVSVSDRDGWLVITVTDDGVGGAEPAVGGGLVGLEDRVAALDGRLSLTSAPGQGTTVRAEIPWRLPS